MIAFLTDWGNSHYVGICKGVIDKIAPDTKVVDFTHEIKPFDVRMAAHIIGRYYKDFPKGTVFLCVVDAEVGTSNKRLAIETDDYYFVGPDYGLFTFVDGIKTIVELNNEEYFYKKSHTFHGRDIFSPAAAYLSKGEKIKNLGKEIQGLKTIEFNKPKITYKETNSSENTTIEVEVAFIDRFGNIELFCKEDEIPFSERYFIDGTVIHRTSTFAQNDFNIHTDSSGYLEIAKFQDRANDYFNLKSGDIINLIIDG
jgi:hypothetical protein